VAVPEFLQAGDVRIAYERTGDGPPLVLMHGAEANRQMFAALVPLLAPHFTVIAYDQRDCGDTEGPPQAATLADLAHDAAVLIREVGLGSAHVFGSSFGGRVAQALALLHPQAIDRLVLGSTWPLPQTYDAINPEGARQIGQLRAQLPATAAELAGWFFPESFLQERPQLREIFANARPQTERSQRRAQAVGGTLNLSPAAIEAPALVLAGQLDRVVPPQVTLQLAALIPDAEPLLLENVGHVTVMQATERVAAALTQFLCTKETLDASRP
jgi:pimeloyl-ACP methyl ester carboxylesterase